MTDNEMYRVKFWLIFTVLWQFGFHVGIIAFYAMFLSRIMQGVDLIILCIPLFFVTCNSFIMQLQQRNIRIILFNRYII